MNYTLLQRNADFMRAFRTVWAAWDGPEPTIADIINKVVSMPAPKFYVNYETAYKFVGRALNDKLPAGNRGSRRQMWHDLASRVSAVRTCYPHISLGLALVYVMDVEGAPSFYLTQKSATALYYKLKRINNQSLKQ